MANTHSCLKHPTSATLSILLTALLLSQGLPATPQKPPAEKPGTTTQGKPQATKKSVKPGINKRFLSKTLNVKKFEKTFETESREVFAHRHRIVKHLGIQQGMTIADIGAGTGLFMDLFSKAVGSNGLLFAVDISPKFIEHLNKRAAKKNLSQVLPIQCTGTSTRLPTASVDIAFTCDTYHHFEHPSTTLGSIKDAIRPGGQLIIVDFERIPGVSRKFIMGHVRCGKQKVIEEIIQAGFLYQDEVKVKGLKENYLIRFRRPANK